MDAFASPEASLPQAPKNDSRGILGFRVLGFWGVGFWGFGVQGFGVFWRFWVKFSVWGFVFGVWSSGFWVWGLGFFLFGAWISMKVPSIQGARLGDPIRVPIIIRMLVTIRLHLRASMRAFYTDISMRVPVRVESEHEPCWGA